MISQQRYLPFGGVRNDVGSISQTDYGYTGQRDLGSMGLMDYKARFYLDTIGRFIQPDSITPGGPQGLNRYSYVNNRPINFNDPTGHDPWWNDPDFYYADVSIYIAPAIAQQNPWIEREPHLWRFIGESLTDRNTGIGPAKVSDNEMETPFGGKIDDHPGTLGLGMRDYECHTFSDCPLDQADSDVADIAMGRRLALRYSECIRIGCKATDMFMALALGANNSLSPKELAEASRIKQYKSQDDGIIINWEEYLTYYDPDHTEFNKNKLIKPFMNAIPDKNRSPNIKWNYLQDLLRVE